MIHSKKEKTKIDEHKEDSKPNHLNDVSFINTADEINIEGNKITFTN